MFTIGNLVQTSGIAHECENNPEFLRSVRNSLSRYMKKDWGDLCADDKALNDSAVATGDDRILAAYKIQDKKIYIITEYDRSVTTILFADEY